MHAVQRIHSIGTDSKQWMMAMGKYYFLYCIIEMSIYIFFLFSEFHEIKYNRIKKKKKRTFLIIFNYVLIISQRTYYKVSILIF